MLSSLSINLESCLYCISEKIPISEFFEYPDSGILCAVLKSFPANSYTYSLSVGFKYFSM